MLDLGEEEHCACFNLHTHLLFRNYFLLAYQALCSLCISSGLVNAFVQCRTRKKP